MWGTQSSGYIGKRLRLYIDQSVTFGGKQVGGIRISHASHLDGEHSRILTSGEGKKTKFIVQPLPDTRAADDKVSLARQAYTETLGMINGMDTDKLQSWWAENLPVLIETIPPSGLEALEKKIEERITASQN